LAERVEGGQLALELAPINPYIIGECVRTAIEQASNIKTLEYNPDFSDLMDRLRRYGDGPGLSFFAIRNVDLSLRKKDYEQALRFANQAIKHTRELPTAYGARARVYAAKRMYTEAENDIRMMEKKIESSGQITSHMDFEMNLVRFGTNLMKKRYNFCLMDLESIEKYDASVHDRLKKVLIEEVQRDKRKPDPQVLAQLKILARKS
jgi:hypothetical protein